MTMDDQEILRVLGGSRADEPGPPDGTPPAPADEWAGPHKVTHPREGMTGRAVALPATLVTVPLALLFLAIWLGSPGPRDALMALGLTALFAGVMALLGFGAYRMSRPDPDAAGSPPREPGVDWHGIGKLLDYPAFFASAFVIFLAWSGVSAAWRAASRGLGRGREAVGEKPRPEAELGDPDD